MYGQRQEISNEEVDERGNREGSERWGGHGQLVEWHFLTRSLVPRVV